MVSINDILFRIYKNPLLQNIRKIDVVDYIKSAMKLLDIPASLEEKRVVLTVQEYRVKTPKDLHVVKQVMAMSLNGLPQRLRPSSDDRIQHQKVYRDQLTSTATYKDVPGWIYTDFESGDIEVIYTGFTVDSAGFPMVPDNESLLKAIDNYIKSEYFTVLYEMGHISRDVLERAEQQYTFYAGQTANAFSMPTPDETESLFNALIRLIPNRDAFETNFKYGSNKEILVNHD